MQLVRSSRFRLTDRRLLFARARLFEDRLELSGLGWTGPYRRILLLDDVARVEWWTTQGREINLALYLHDDSVVSLWVPGPGLWKFAVEAHAGRLRPERTEEPSVPVSAA